MRAYPRIRKIVKWGGAVLSALLIATWLGSAWFRVKYMRFAGLAGSLEHGRIHLYDLSGITVIGEEKGWHADRRAFQFFWAPEKARFWWGYTIPLWFVVAPSCAATALAWHLDTLARRRARVGFCPKCLYDCRGLAAGAVCPECGAASASLPPAKLV